LPFLYESSCLIYNFRPQEINKEELEENSMRCGRKLAKDGEVSMGCDNNSQIAEKI
jgi:hypothetical protein